MKYFLGLHVDRNIIDKTTTINQHRFIDRILTKFGFDKCNPTATPSNASMKLSVNMHTDNDIHDTAMINVPYRVAVGSLMYLMIGIRPDIAFSVSIFSRYIERSTIQHRNCIKKILGTLEVHQT